MARVRPVDFEDRLTLVEHLDELRTRIVISVLAFAAAFGLCFWQSQRLLEIANRPLPDGRDPITFGVTEPFMATVTIAGYAALLIAMPVILYQLYAFVLPALSSAERRAIVPFLAMVPVLFIAGAVFAYLVVVPAATSFLLSFNSESFEIEIRARDYYSFFVMAEISIGLLFQLPIGVLAVTRLGIVTPEQIARNRRYAVLGVAVVAMLVTPPDPISMLVSMGPLILLFEGSLILARFLGRPPKESDEAPAAEPTAERPG